MQDTAPCLRHALSRPLAAREVSVRIDTYLSVGGLASLTPGRESPQGLSVGGDAGIVAQSSDASHLARRVNEVTPEPQGCGARCSFLAFSHFSFSS